jgi:hypothetical protein
MPDSELYIFQKYSKCPNACSYLCAQAERGGDEDVEEEKELEKPANFEGVIQR